MAFDQSTLTDAKATRDGADLLVSWASTATEGTAFQVYIDGVLIWHGTQRSCTLPYPTDADGSTLPIDVGAVLPEEESADLSANLPDRGYANRARLTWFGGTYLGDDLLGFNVYRGAAAGGAVSYASRIAFVPAYPQGVLLDGAGVGGVGRGGAGRAASTYSWRSGPLPAGTWHFGIRPVDAAGNEGAATEATYAATAPPNPPAPDAAGRRLTLAYDPITHIATLAWQPSPP
jgi:hypothetical protein